MVAMVLLTRIPDQLNVVELVTADSPLGMDDMDTVLKRPLTGGLHRPDRVGDWVNVWCPADAVAIGRPLRGDWGDRLTEVITNNPKGPRPQHRGGSGRPPRSGCHRRRSPLSNRRASRTSTGREGRCGDKCACP